MRVITLAGSPRFPSRSSALLEYAREKLNSLDIEVCHWNLHNFARKTCFTPALTARRSKP
jgi:FMN reductase